MEIGLIKWYDNEKGFGVIRTPLKNEVFIRKNGFTTLPEKILPRLALIFETENYQGKVQAKRAHAPSSYLDWKIIMNKISEEDTIIIEDAYRKPAGYKRFLVGPDIKLSKNSYTVFQMLKKLNDEEIFEYTSLYFFDSIIKINQISFFKFATIILNNVKKFKEKEELIKNIINLFQKNNNPQIFYSAWVNKDLNFLGIESMQDFNLSEYVKYTFQLELLEFFETVAENITHEHIEVIANQHYGEEMLLVILNKKINFLSNKLFVKYFEIIKTIFTQLKNLDIRKQAFIYVERIYQNLDKIKNDELLFELLKFNQKHEDKILILWHHHKTELTIDLLIHLKSINYNFTKIKEDFYTQFCIKSTWEEALKSYAICEENTLFIYAIKDYLIKPNSYCHPFKMLNISESTKSLFNEIFQLEMAQLQLNTSKQKLFKISELIKILGRDYLDNSILTNLDSLAMDIFAKDVKELHENNSRLLEYKNLHYSYKINTFLISTHHQLTSFLGNFINNNCTLSLIIEAWQDNLIPNFIDFLTTNINSFSNQLLDIIFSSKLLPSKLILKILLERYSNKSELDWILNNAKIYLGKEDLLTLNNICLKDIDEESYYELWLTSKVTDIPSQTIEKKIKEGEFNFELFRTWLDKKLCDTNELSAIILKYLKNDFTIINRKDFYYRFTLIQEYLKFSSSWITEYKPFVKNFDQMILWYLQKTTDFDLDFLLTKFIYFKPAEQVKIIKRIFYLKKHNDLDFSLEKFNKIVRADLDLFLLNESFDNDFVLDISTDLILQILNNYKSKSTFLSDSELLKIVLKDVGILKRKKFQISNYFEKCEGRMEVKWNFKTENKIIKKVLQNNNYVYQIKFPYNSEIVTKIQIINNRKYDDVSKSWFIPLSSEDEVIKFGIENKFLLEFDRNIYSNNNHLSEYKRSSIPRGITFCEGRLANNIDALTQKKFWWCGNGKCQEACITDHLDPSSDYNKLTLLDIIQILKINVDESNKYGFYPHGKYFHLISHFNRFNRLLERMYCNECNDILFPNHASNYAAYTVVRFSCRNTNCDLCDNEIYLNHCLNKDCNNIIDSRTSKKCNNGLYICNQCGSCCSHNMLSKRLDNLRTSGGFIHQSLIESVAEKLGHLEKEEYYCYICEATMPKIIDDISHGTDYFKCTKCVDIVYRPDISIKRPHLHLRKKDYPVFYASKLGL